MGRPDAPRSSVGWFGRSARTAERSEAVMVGVLMALFVIEVGLFGASAPGERLLTRAECALAGFVGDEARAARPQARCPCGEVCDDDVRDEDAEDRDVQDRDACDGCDRPDPDEPDETDD